MHRGPQNPGASGRPDPGLAVAVGVGAALVFLVLPALLPRLEWWDAWIASAFAEMRGCARAPGVSAFTDAAPYIAALVAAASAVAALRSVRRAYGFSVCTLMAIALVLVQVLKVVFERYRPGGLPWGESAAASFPSGHVAHAAVCIAAALRLQGRPRHAVRRWATAALAVAFVLAVAASRLYLERHWLTDVVGGLLLGLAFWGLAGALSTRSTHRLAAGATLVLVGLTLTGATGIRIHLSSPSGLASREEAPSVRVAGSATELVLTPLAGQGDVLELVAEPLRIRRLAACPHLELLVDGAPVTAQPLRFHKRSYSFALPALGPGPHRIALRVQPSGEPGAADATTAAIRRMALEP